MPCGEIGVAKFSHEEVSNDVTGRNSLHGQFLVVDSICNMLGMLFAPGSFTIFLQRIPPYF
jgi:hypothetical protein